MAGFDGDLTKALRRINRMVDELDGSAMSDRLLRVATKVQPDAAAEVRADLGDLDMSHWTRRRPIQILTEAKLSDPKMAVVRPRPRTRGPWRVLESGRRSWQAGEGKLRFVQTKTKGLRTRHRIVKRNVGGSGGRATWSRSTVAMTNHARQLLTADQAKAFRSVFKG